MQYRQKLRKEILDSRQEFDISLYKNANEAVCQKSIELIYDLNLDATLLGIYWPIKGEIDLLSKFIKYFPKLLALPVIVEDNIFFTTYKENDSVVRVKGDIYQPVLHDEVIPDIIFTPGLAFNLQGYRLGFGKGHYDKYLAKIAKLQKFITVGVCFHMWLLESFEIHKNDYKLDYIITDKTLLKL